MTASLLPTRRTLKRAALAALAAALFSMPALAQEAAAPLAAPVAAQAAASQTAAAPPREPLHCGAATIHAEASVDPQTLIHTAVFDPVWIDALFSAGCAQTQIGCNSCSQTASGKTICGAASCTVTAPTTISASCSWSIAEFKCRQWREDGPAHEGGGWAKGPAPASAPVLVQAD